MGDPSFIKQAESILHDLLGRLGIVAEVEVSKEGEAVKLSLSGENLGALIGYQGQTLSSLQLILGLLVTRMTGQFLPIRLDAGGYRAEKEARLTQLSRQAALEVLSTGESVALPIMSSWERRVVHTALTDEKSVITESEGEEGFRRVVVKPALKTAP